MDENSTEKKKPSSQLHSSKLKQNISKQNLGNLFNRDDILFHKDVANLSSQLSSYDTMHRGLLKPGFVSSSILRNNIEVGDLA